MNKKRFSITATLFVLFALALGLPVMATSTAPGDSAMKATPYDSAIVGSSQQVAYQTEQTGTGTSALTAKADAAINGMLKAQADSGTEVTADITKPTTTGITMLAATEQQGTLTSLTTPATLLS